MDLALNSEGYSNCFLEDMAALLQQNTETHSGQLLSHSGLRP